MDKGKRIKMESSRNWSDLPSELLELILRRLVLVDTVCCKLVCSSWHNVVKSYTSNHVTYKPLVPQSPWLLIPPRQGDDKDDAIFYSPAEQKVYRFRNLIIEGGVEDSHSYMPTANVVGCSYGWLSIWNNKLVTIHLLNPITKEVINFLPPLRSDDTVFHVHISSDPSCNNTFYVVVHYVDFRHGGLIRTMFHKHGGEKKTKVITPSITDQTDAQSPSYLHPEKYNTWIVFDNIEGAFGRIVFRDNIMYGLHLYSIRVFDLEEPTSNVKSINFRHPQNGRGTKEEVYVVESQGEILYVSECRDGNSSRYEIYKLNFSASNDKVECVKVEHLQDRCLVLDGLGFSSLSLSTGVWFGFEPNSIYDIRFEEASGRSSRRLPVHKASIKAEAYNLENKSFKSVFESGPYDAIKHCLWIVPNPCMML